MPNHFREMISTFFLKSWWVIFFFLACGILFEQNKKKIEREYSKLALQLEVLKEEKTSALEIQKDLLLQINSLKDPAWIELLLMKDLGVVPQNQIKVFFSNDDKEASWNP